MTVVKESRIALRLSSDLDALIRHAAEVEGTSITEFTVAATMSRAIDVLADRRLFAIDDAAWGEFLAVLDRPVSHKPRLEQLYAEPSVFTETGADTACPIRSPPATTPAASTAASPASMSTCASALGNHVQGASFCFVTCRDARVVGCYALASASVQHREVTGTARRNMPDPVPTATRRRSRTRTDPMWLPLGY